MEIGFITDGRPRDLEFAVRHGIPTVELSGFLAEDLDAFHQIMPTFDDIMRRVPDVAAYVRQGTLKVASAAVYTNVMHPDERLRQRYRDAMREMLEACPQLETGVLTVFAGDHPEWSYGRKLDEFEGFFGPLIERARQIGVTVAVARCHWMNFASPVSVWLELRRRFPDLAFKYDPSHAHYEGIDYVQELSTCASWLAHFHAKDIQLIGAELYESPPPGLGDIQWGKVMSILHHVRYPGAVCYELQSEHWVQVRRYEGILIAYRFLKQFVAPEAEEE